jgi:hypothetical protein
VESLKVKARIPADYFISGPITLAYFSVPPAFGSGPALTLPPTVVGGGLQLQAAEGPTGQE